MDNTFDHLVAALIELDRRAARARLHLAASRTQEEVDAIMIDYPR